jgi:hypothetical protein
MAYYLKGIGDAPTRVNEILPSLDAKINKFLGGHVSGVIKGMFGEFACTTIDRGVRISGGLMQAYGFFGCADTETQINFVMPATTNYLRLYAKINLSVVPNTFSVKATPMSNSDAYTFRQDNLTGNPNGVFQLPLWKCRLTSSTITLTDMRAFIAKPLDAVNAENYTAGGGIASKITEMETAIGTKAPIISPTFKGTVTITDKPTTVTRVLTLTGNGTSLAATNGTLEAGWYRLYLGGAGGGKGGNNNNGSGGSGGTGGVCQADFLVPYSTNYYACAGGAGQNAPNVGGSGSGGGGGGGSSLFAVPALGILLVATGGAGGGGLGWSGGRGSTGGAGGNGGGFGGGSNGGNPTGEATGTGGAGGAGYPCLFSTAIVAKGGGVGSGGETGYNNMNSNRGGGYGQNANGQVLLSKLT